MNRYQAHKAESRIRLAVETCAFFLCIALIVLFLSLDGIHA